ncbi:MAG TPA: hypothetical protein VLC79_01805 [Cellvibrio sp.]|nr:hypothetical protein [Cellvibrio sp.]
MKTIMDLPTLSSGVRLLVLLCCTALMACGGGGSSKQAPVSSQSITLATSAASVSAAINSSSGSPNNSSVNSSVAELMSISGRVTYDFVPHNPNNYGLDYAATVAKAGRNLVVELIDNRNVVVATTNTDNFGSYSLGVESGRMVKVRVKAQSLRTQTPAWNFKVTDNTNANSLYVMDGNLIAASEATAVRNLHANSGWGGSGYTDPRVAGPFAILDSVLSGVDRIVAADSQVNFSPLELRWSVRNRTAEGDLTLGEIGTSFFSGTEIYILGSEDDDTDEYDQHVVLHEWGHYIERELSRSDSIGGDHMKGDKLDMRVAMSEGFANAFSAMIIDDPDYRDASGTLQGGGFSNDVSQTNNTVKGWYSEASVQSVLYNFYASGNGKTPGNFADIFKVMHSVGYLANEAMISIYVFAAELRNLLPMQAANFNSLLAEQDIELTNALGDGEVNGGGYTKSLPVYKQLVVDNSAVNVCSTNRFGSYNKLAVAQFLLLKVSSESKYQISATEVGINSGNSDPDLYLYRNGKLFEYSEDTQIDQEVFSLTLPAGTYVLEVVDDRVKYNDGLNQTEACFDVRMQRVN